MSETKTCPFCAEEVAAAALLCKHCKEKLAPILTAPAARPIPEAPQSALTSSIQLSQTTWAILLAVLALVIGALFVWSNNLANSMTS